MKVNKHIKETVDDVPRISFKEEFFYLIIVIFTFCLYANTLGHQWALDDLPIFRDNAFVTKGISGYKEIMTTFTTHSTIDNPEIYQYRPLPQLQFAAEWHFFPDNPSVYHFFNVFYYALGCVLLFVVLRKLFSPKSHFFSLLIVLIYIAHPMHTEVVANIKSRDEILLLIFAIATILFSFLYIDKPKKRYLLAVFFSFFAALLSKESAVTFFAAIPVTIYFFRKTTLKHYINLLIVLILPIIAYLLIRFAVLNEYTASEVSIIHNYLANETLFSRWACAIMLMGKYLILLFIPYQQVCDYSYNQLPYVDFGSWQTLISLFVYVFLTIYAISGIKKKKTMAFCIFFYLITISIYSNLIYLIGSSFADRFLFIPSIGYCVVAVYLLFKLSDFDDFRLNKFNIRGLISVFILLSILLSFSIKTVIRSAEWENNFTLYQADIEKSPNSAKLNILYGEALRDKAFEYQNKPYNTLEEKEQNNFGYAFYMLKSMSSIRKSLDIYARNSSACDRLGVAYYSLFTYYRQYAMLDSAEKYYLKSLNLNPHSTITNYNAGLLYYQREDYQKAKQYYLAAASNSYSEDKNYLELGTTYSMLGYVDSARFYFEKYRAIYGDTMSNYINSYLAIAHFHSNELDYAISLLNNVIEKDCNYLFAYQLKIYFFTQTKQIANALKTADNMIAIAPNNPIGYSEKGSIFQTANQLDSSQYYYQMAKNIPLN
jgi:Tfp pilus assembly protein PilF